MRHLRLALLCLGAPLALAAQSPTARPAVLVLGTYHMANPGLDMHNVKADDHLGARRQGELEELVTRLAAFAPTKIALEVPLAQDSLINARYAAYLAGTFTPTASETYQVGFRLAKRLGHTRVYATDHKRDLAIGAAMAYAQRQGQMGRLAEGNARIQGFMKDAQQRMSTMTVREILAETNSPKVDSLHGGYLQLATVGADTNYVGADVTGDWYVRNLRIYANLARIAGPGDRVLAIYGSGHRPLLNEFLRHSRLFEVVEANTYLR